MKKRTSRMTAFFGVMVFIFSIIVSRLVYLQLINGDYYQALAEDMGEKPKLEIAPRGEILDRNGKKLATNKIGYSIIYTPQRTKATDEEINKAIINAIDILYAAGEESKILTNSLPVVFDADSGKYYYRTTSEGKYEIFKFARSVKKPNDFKTSFDEGFDYALLEEFQTKLDNLKKSNPLKADEEIRSFEAKELSAFDPEKDAKETFIKFAERYRLGPYKLEAQRLYAVTSIRHALKATEYRQYMDIEIAKNVKKEAAWDIQLKNDEMPGISMQTVSIRNYPFGELGSAFLGRLGKISEFDKEKYADYDMSRELVGKTNLEAALENRMNNNLGIQLRGEPGVSYYRVDKLGRIIEEAGELEAVPGDSVVTTIDIDVQKAAEDSLEEVMAGIREGKYSNKGEKFPSYRGAVVVMNINTGEILALASRPGFDPNDFAETGSPTEPLKLAKYLMDEDGIRKADEDRNAQVLPRPMLNYATQGTAPPGSIFKPFTALAALEEGVITKNTKITDKGTFVVDSDKDINCWIYSKEYGFSTHGTINVVSALQKSCNYFFNTVGEMLGNDRLSDWGRKFGIVKDEYGGRPKTGVEIGESAGYIGSTEVIKSLEVSSLINDIVTTLKKPDNGGYTIDRDSLIYKAISNMLSDGLYDETKLEELGITNGKAKDYIKGIVKRINTRVKNLSNNQVLYASIGQGMVALTPLQMAQLLSTIINGGTRYSAQLVKQVLNYDGTVKRDIKPEILSKVELDPNNVKTVLEGMSEVTDEGGTAASIFRGYPIKTAGKTGTAQSGSSNPDRAAYAWYAGYAPVDNPEIVVISVLYDGGHGSYAANTAKAVFDVYFKDRPEMKKYLEGQR